MVKFQRTWNGSEKILKFEKFIKLGNEHKKHIKLKEKYHNVVSRHLSLYHDGDSNFINWENIEILHQEPNFYKRLFAEMVFIKKEGHNSLNKITDNLLASKVYFCFCNFKIWSIVFPFMLSILNNVVIILILQT